MGPCARSSFRKYSQIFKFAMLEYGRSTYKEIASDEYFNKLIWDFYTYLSNFQSTFYRSVAQIPFWKFSVMIQFWIFLR